MRDPAADPPQIPVLTGLAPLATRYDAVLCDLWGCVHDGVAPLPGALDCLARLRAAGRRVLFVSNAPRPAWAVRRQLEGIGVPADACDGIVSSGDATIDALNRRADPWHAALGRRYFHLGPSRSVSLLTELQGEPVGFETAELIINTGLINDETETVADYQDLLSRACARRLPMVCANPDVVVNRGARRVLCAGALADAYEAMGGPVRRHGKPGPGIFELAFERLGAVDRARVVMVGDGFHTDIAGAAAVGIDAVWVAGGIHAAEAGYAPGGRLDPDGVAAACARAGQRPVAAVPALAW